MYMPIPWQMGSERQLEVNCELLLATWEREFWELRSVTWSLIIVPHSTNITTRKNEKQVSSGSQT